MSAPDGLAQRWRRRSSSDRRRRVTIAAARPRSLRGANDVLDGLMDESTASATAGGGALAGEALAGTTEKKERDQANQLQAAVDAAEEDISAFVSAMATELPMVVTFETALSLLYNVHYVLRLTRRRGNFLDAPWDRRAERAGGHGGPAAQSEAMVQSVGTNSMLRRKCWVCEWWSARQARSASRCVPGPVGAGNLAVHTMPTRTAAAPLPLRIHCCCCYSIASSR